MADVEGWESLVDWHLSFDEEHLEIFPLDYWNNPATSPNNGNVHVVGRQELQPFEPPHQHGSSTYAVPTFGKPTDNSYNHRAPTQQHFRRSSDSSRQKASIYASRGGSDSDDSWTEVEDQCQWRCQLRQELEIFRETGGTYAIVTPPLSSSKRSQIHSSASILGLSHMSVAAGGKKRVLISKCAIGRATHSGVAWERKWNPATGKRWQKGFVEPRVLIVNWATPSDSAFLDFLRQSGLPLPTCQEVETRATERTCYAVFSEAAEAATVVYALRTPNVYQMSGTYLRFPDNFYLTGDLLATGFKALSMSISAFRSNDLAMQISQVVRRRPAFGDTENPSRSPSTPLSMNGMQSQSFGASCQLLPSLNGSNETVSTRSTTHFKDVDGSSAASSALDSDYSVGTNTSKKRRRLPRDPAGYKCSDCDRTFHYAGERSKHIKQVHLGERPHACDQCDGCFSFPKDLKRHKRAVHKEYKNYSQRRQATRGDDGLAVIANIIDDCHLDSSQHLGSHQTT